MILDLPHGTSKISWQLIFSAIQLAKLDVITEPIDLNIHCLGAIVLSCASIDAFSSELVSIAKAINLSKDFIQSKEFDLLGDTLAKICHVKCAETPIFGPYKSINNILKCSNKDLIKKMGLLREIRNEVAHYSHCDTPIPMTL